MILNPRSESNLEGVHPDLVKVVRRAAEITAVPFIVIEGARTLARQRQLVASGASQTLKSRHVPEMNACGVACAVDLAALIGKTVRWDWPLYERLAVAVKLAAGDVAIPIEWGGDWPHFKDGPHYQLPWRDYP